jgi:hypothetical protein
MSEASRSETMENAKIPSEANFNSLGGLYLVCRARTNLDAGFREIAFGISGPNHR